jgi:hypothetical protein
LILNSVIKKATRFGWVALYKIRGFISNRVHPQPCYALACKNAKGAGNSDAKEEAGFRDHFDAFSYPD